MDSLVVQPAQKGNGIREGDSGDSEDSTSTTGKLCTTVTMCERSKGFIALAV